MRCVSLEKECECRDDGEREYQREQDSRHDDKWNRENKFPDDTRHEQHRGKYPRCRQRGRDIRPFEITESEQHSLSGSELIGFIILVKTCHDEDSIIYQEPQREDERKE